MLSSSCCVARVVGEAVGEIVGEAVEEEEETSGWAEVDSIGDSRDASEDDFVEDSGTCCFCELVE